MLLHAATNSKPLEYTIHQYKLNYHRYINSLQDTRVVKKAFNEQHILHDTHTGYRNKSWVGQISNLHIEYAIPPGENMNKEQVKHTIKNK